MPVVDNKHKTKPRRSLSEGDVVDRIERLNGAICPPLEFWSVLLEILAPDEMGDPPLAAEPTDAPPGTEDRVRVMAERVARGESPFHPLDFDWDADLEEADRVFQVAKTHRNGASARLQQPVMIQLPQGVARRDGADPGELPPPLASYGLHSPPERLSLGNATLPPRQAPAPTPDQPTAVPEILEGFLLRGEAVLVVGRLKPTQRARKQRQASACRQLLLWEEEAQPSPTATPSQLTRESA